MAFGVFILKEGKKARGQEGKRAKGQEARKDKEES
jgi:hypothetical protein